jgi:hypothetical protein
MTGRPTKLTPELAAIVLDAVEAGNFLATAGSEVGVDYSTLKRWMRRGKSDAPEHVECRAFRVAVLRARAVAERKAVAKVRKAKDWKAAAWYLERSHRARWGPVSRVQAEVTGKGGGPIDVRFYLPANGRDDGPIAGGPAAAGPAGNVAGE